MELELGLGLPSYSPLISMKGLDLNCSFSNNNKGVEMEKNKGHKNYQMFLDDGDVDDEVESKDLSLLLWSGQQPNEEDDGRAGRWRKLRQANGDQNISGEENHEIVGWPPVNSLRKEYLLQRHHHHGGGPVLANRRAGERAFKLRNSMYVKVKMEGVAIGRKINLRLCDSYQALTNTLINMFAKYIERDERREGDYRILYQDRDGDCWMLTGDVPWERFVESVQRMEILRDEHY